MTGPYGSSVRDLVEVVVVDAAVVQQAAAQRRLGDAEQSRASSRSTALMSCTSEGISAQMNDGRLRTTVTPWRSNMRPRGRGDGDAPDLIRARALGEFRALDELQLREPRDERDQREREHGDERDEPRQFLLEGPLPELLSGGRHVGRRRALAP